MKKKSRFKTFLIVLLSILLALQTAVVVGVAATKKMGDDSDIVIINDDTQYAVAKKEEAPAPADGGAEDAPADAAPAEEGGLDAGDLLNKIMSGEQSLSDLLRGILYKDSIVSAIMSAVYPMLYDAVKGMLLAPATGFHLYGNGKDIAKLLAGTPYTIVDVDGVRKPLNEVLAKVGTNWKYMDREITWTDKDGNEKTTNLYNAIDWGVHDANSFYEALNDCALAFSGLFETTLQNKEINLKITAEMINAILEAGDNVPTIPGVNLVLGLIPVATALNKNGQFDGTGRSGYQYGIIYLFNILGLEDGEYPTNEEFCGYETPGEVLKALIETVLYAVDKLMTDPATNLSSILLNLANAIESGQFVSRMKKMSLFIDFSDLVSKITQIAKIDLASKEYFNLGDTIVNLVEGMGIPLTKGFNGLLQGLVKKLLGDGVSVPTFNTRAFLACGTARTLSNGNRVYKANAEATLGFLARYILQADILKLILDKVDIFDAKTTNQIVTAFSNASDDVSSFVAVVLKVLLRSIGKKPAEAA